MEKETKFYEALERIFEGAPIEGNGGFINLLHIKQKYYKKVIAEFKKKVDNDSVISADFKEDFFDLLYTFFEKYFSESGSIYFTKTSANDKIYEKVYENNKDVSLFWKTNMLYYVKTDALYNSTYITIHSDKQNLDFVFYFDVSNLNLKKNNEKQTISFVYKEKRAGKIPEVHTDIAGNVTFVIDVLSDKTKTDVEEISTSTGVYEVEVIEKAIKMFNKQSSIDYFINKNAKAFLEEQLELFLHTRLFEDANVFDAEKLAQYKKFKEYAKYIINFISQFENELVRIWNKPKFALNSNYVISLDRVNDDIIAKIKKHKNLMMQIEEWQKLGMVDKDFKLDEKSIKEHMHLPIDTKYFKDLELAIIGQFDNLDEALDGRLIHSENYQALNTMCNRYEGKVQCCYIDPPFNTGKDSFAYIDNYRRSSWLSFLYDRLLISNKLLTNNGSIFVHLDENQSHYFKTMFDNIIGEENFVNEIIWRYRTYIGTVKDYFPKKHDTIFWYKKNEKPNFKLSYAGNKEDSPDFERWKNYINDEGCILYGKHPTTDSRFTAYLNKYIKKFGQPKEGDIIYQNKGYVIDDVWEDIIALDAKNKSERIESFSHNGQKPETLIARILDSLSLKESIVLDYFSGSATTIATAKKSGNKFIGVELMDYFYTTILPRMKWVIFGEKGGSTIHYNFEGGGFFKYYSFEQYEDTLSRVVYDKNINTIYEKDAFSQYVFFADKKLVDVLDASKDKFELDFDKLYENIDLPETISLLLGQPIVKITENEVMLVGRDEPIKYNTKVMNNDEKVKFVQLLKPLLWWGE